MHAYLIVGNGDGVDQQVEKLAKNLVAQTVNFTLRKISDVRELATFTNLKQNKKTGVILKDVDKATLPALNAFLKNLEEPQENILYFMTASSKLNVLPTIVSRSKVVKTTSKKVKTNQVKETDKFLKMNTAQRLLYIKGVRDRKSAVFFVESLIDKTHQLLIEGKSIKTNAKIAQKAELAREALLANGNATLQLTNLILELE